MWNIRVALNYFLFLIAFSSQAQISLIFKDSIENIIIEGIVVQQFASHKFDNTIDLEVSNAEGIVTLDSYESADTLFFTSTHLQYN